MSIGTKIYNNLEGDKKIWLIILLMTIFSLMAVYSATGTIAFQHAGGRTEMFLIKQVIYLGLGWALMLFCYNLSYTQYSRFAPLLLMISIPLLIYTLFFGLETNEARRWIELPFGFTFQTSDFAKLALILFLARSIAIRQENIKDFYSAFVPIIAPILLVCGLIALADLSTAALLFITCLAMMFIGRIHMKYIFFVLMMGVVLFALLVLLGTLFPDLTRVGTWISRLSDFFVVEETHLQNQQALIAIANGGWIGEGPGNSIQRNFLYASHADFIYAIICEEYGIVGGILVIAAFFGLFFRTTSIVTKSPKTFGAMLAIGLCLNIVIQAFYNIAVSLHLVPVTGLTLPLVSWGGTSLIFTCISLGIILSVSRFIEKKTVKVNA